MRGHRPTTSTATHVRAPGSPRSPTCSTCRNGRTAHVSSCAANAHTPAPSYGSPTPTGTASRPSSPTPNAAARRHNTPTWRCATAPMPESRTASEPRGKATGKATGLRNLPCKGYAQNKVWLELALAAADLLSWTQKICLDGDLATCEPAALRYRLLHNWSTSPASQQIHPGRPLASLLLLVGVQSCLGNITFRLRAAMRPSSRGGGGSALARGRTFGLVGGRAARRRPGRGGDSGAPTPPGR